MVVVVVVVVVVVAAAAAVEAPLPLPLPLPPPPPPRPPPAALALRQGMARDGSRLIASAVQAAAGRLAHASGLCEQLCAPGGRVLLRGTGGGRQLQISRCCTRI